jgi:hypothetical protein
VKKGFHAEHAGFSLMAAVFVARDDFGIGRRLAREVHIVARFSRSARNWFSPSATGASLMRLFLSANGYGPVPKTHQRPSYEAMLASARSWSRSRIRSRRREGDPTC